MRVRDKSNEITALPVLLRGLDLRGTVTTMDALLTQQAMPGRSSKGHGRLETRRLDRTCALNGWIPGLAGGGQVLRWTYQRIQVKTGEVSAAVTYGIASLGWQEARAAQVERFWRGR